ncbi:helix-turn-helix domain-containing protein [Chryseobacterium sp.]|uniref:helix-turn-helix domain-containing protein n=1 Tax=Chryseobacterium sp. TaxID=1871047 RepID=UPI0025C24231|nr:helix-turn-helix domain-containing protein [Chryseobacterium sp.]MBV8325160.1 helix-turn-helix domain-containing protein [Chryseobacterium sp.]
MVIKTHGTKKITPDFRCIYSDILKLYPEKETECRNILSKKELSAIDILELNNRIFGLSQKDNHKYHAYQPSDILRMLHYQKVNKLNNVQLAHHFKLSRNSITKWKKMFHDEQQNNHP